MKAHNDGLTKLQLLDKESILITGGKDKQIKVNRIQRIIKILILKNSSISYQLNGEIVDWKLN